MNTKTLRTFIPVYRIDRPTGPVTELAARTFSSEMAARTVARGPNVPELLQVESVIEITYAPTSARRAPPADLVAIVDRLLEEQMRIAGNVLDAAARAGGDTQHLVETLQRRQLAIVTIRQFLRDPGQPETILHLPPSGGRSKPLQLKAPRRPQIRAGQNGLCFLCRKSLAGRDSLLNRHHVIPQAKLGKGLGHANHVVTHADCNTRWGHKDPTADQLNLLAEIHGRDDVVGMLRKWQDLHLNSPTKARAPLALLVAAWLERAGDAPLKDAS